MNPTEPTKSERIAKLNKQISNIEHTIYPDNYDEVKGTMIMALEDRIDAIVEGRV